jgi:hypothetical protein
VGSPDLLEKFDATFNTYWESPEYESYETERDKARTAQRPGAVGERGVSLGARRNRIGSVRCYRLQRAR